MRHASRPVAISRPMLGENQWRWPRARVGRMRRARSLTGCYSPLAEICRSVSNSISWVRGAISPSQAALGAPVASGELEEEPRSTHEGSDILNVRSMEEMDRGDRAHSNPEQRF